MPRSLVIVSWQSAGLNPADRRHSLSLKQGLYQAVADCCLHIFFRSIPHKQGKWSCRDTNLMNAVRVPQEEGKCFPSDAQIYVLHITCEHGASVQILKAITVCKFETTFTVIFHKNASIVDVMMALVSWMCVLSLHYSIKSARVTGIKLVDEPMSVFYWLTATGMPMFALFSLWSCS